MLKKRKRSITNFVIMFAFLFASILFTIAAFSGTSEARFTSSNSTDGIIIDTGHLDIIVTDNNGNPLGPISFNDLDPNVNFQSDNYYVRITNNGSIPCKVRISIANPYGDIELQNKVVARGYVAVGNSNLSIGYNYISYSPKLFENKYLQPGETTEAYIKFFVFATSNESFNVGFDLSIKAIQADNMDGYASAKVASTSMTEADFMNTFVKPNTVVPQVTTAPTLTVTDAVYGSGTVEATTGSAITVEPVQTQPTPVQQPSTVTDAVYGNGTVQTTTGSAITVEPVQTQPTPVQQPNTVTDAVYGNGTVEATTGSAITVEPVQTQLTTVQEPETVTVPEVVDSTSTVETPTGSAITVEPVQTQPTTVQQPETVTVPEVVDSTSTVETPTSSAITAEPVQTQPTTVQQPETVKVPEVVDSTSTVETPTGSAITVEPVQVQSTAVQQQETQTVTQAVYSSSLIEPTTSIANTSNEIRMVQSLAEPLDSTLIVNNLMEPIVIAESAETVQSIPPDTVQATNQIMTPEVTIQSQAEILNTRNFTQTMFSDTATQQTFIPEVKESNLATNYIDTGESIAGTQVPIDSGPIIVAQGINYTSSESLVMQVDSKSYIVDTNVPINPEQIIANQSIDNTSLESVNSNIVLSETSISTDVPINPEQIIST